MDYIKRLDFFYKIKILMVEYMKNDGFNFDFARNAQGVSI